MTDDDGPKVWLLTDGSYSSYHVVGAFATEAEALAIRDALRDSIEDLGVESVPVLTGLTVEHLWSSLSLSCTIYWHGRLVGERYNDDAPFTFSVVHGLPDDEDQYREPAPAPLTIDLSPTEQDYTLGVHLRVHGTDIERVRKVYSEQRAILVADPATATINAWVRSDYLPRWTFGRGENAALAPHLARALEAAGKGELVRTHIDEGS